MKKRINGNKIAFAGIGAAVSLGAIIASFYISQISLSLNILAAFGLMIPLSKQYYRESILSYVAVCLLGGIFANIHIIPFVMIGGAYTIFSVAIYNKRIKLHLGLSYIIKIFYSCLVFFILYYVTQIFFLDLSKIGINLSGSALYLTLNLIFVVLFMIYDTLLLYAYKLIVQLVERITRGRSW